VQRRVVEFLEERKHAGDCLATLEIKEQALAEFCLFLQTQREKNDWREVAKADLDAFARWQNSRPHKQTGNKLSVVHINRTVSTVKSFMKFLATYEYVMRDVGTEVSLFKQDRRLPRDVMTENEVQKFLGAINVKTLTGRRDYCLFRFLYQTGLRKTELVDLRLHDLDFDEGTVFVLGKGQKRRYVPLGPNTVKILRDYLRHVRPLLLCRNIGQDRIFVARGGSRFSKNSLPELCRAYVQKAGIAKKITLHSFRHTCATHLLERGASVRYIQELLGHECLETTEIYTRVSTAKLRAVYERTHPREVLFSEEQGEEKNILDTKRKSR
jgi:integrase/recombinase XerD